MPRKASPGWRVGSASIRTLPSIIERDADGNAIKAFARYINLSEKVSEILTTELEYSFTNDFGAFRPKLSYTRVLDEHFTIIPGAAPANRVGTAWGSNEHGLVGSVEWTAGKYAAGSIRSPYAELLERPNRYLPSGWPLRTPLLRPAVDDGRLLHHR